MKRLIKWIVKKYLTKEAIKEAIRRGNASLAGVEVSEAKAKVIAVGNDVSETLAKYLAGYADDGRIDDAELAAVNAQTDAMVEKYVSDAMLEAMVDRVLG